MTAIRRLDERGYVQVYVPGNPHDPGNGYVREHTLVWEQEHGPVPPDHHVHHLNHDIADNRPENLGLVHRRVHMAYHVMLAAQGRRRKRASRFLSPEGLNALKQVMGRHLEATMERPADWRTWHWTPAELHELRMSAQLNQEQLGGLLGVTTRSIDNWELGNSSPRVGLKGYLKAFELATYELAGNAQGGVR